MKKKLLVCTKEIICLCLFISGVLLSKDVWSKELFQGTTSGIVKDDLPKNGLNADSVLRLKEVPILYGVQSIDKLVQATSYLDGKKLESSPVNLLSNALVGQLPGLYASQTNGAPRFDNPDLSLRGRSPLVVIDGVPRYNLVSLDNGKTLYDALSINPEQVESITLLKDALSTAMLGNRGMDGVLLITTRKGSLGSTIDFTVQGGVQTPIGMRKPLSSYDYALLYNEASINSNRSPVYTQDQLDAYKTGSDPFLFPDVDWRSTLLKDNALSQRYNLSAGGDYARLKYFLSLDYQSQEGLLKEKSDNKQPSNLDYKRYLFRSNIELALDKRLSVSLNVLGNFQGFTQPGVGYETIFKNILNTPNNAFPVYNFNGSFGGSRIYSANPYAQSVATGYMQNTMQAASVDVGIKRVMDDVVKGSWIKALISFNPSYEQQIDRSKNYNAYSFPVTGDTTKFLRVNKISDQINTSAVIERIEQSHAEVSTGIDRTWGKSDFSGLLMGSYDNIQVNNLLGEVYQTVSTRLSYSFDRRYNIEAVAAYSGNNRFAPGNQFDFYPAGGLSWNVHNERFFEKVKFFNEMKLRGTYGKVGNANPGYYVFNQNYSGGPAYFFGTGATSTSSIRQSNIANPNRITEKANKLNIGLDLTFSQHKGWLNFDYYNNRQYDLLQVRGNNSSVFGQTYPSENIGINKYYGIEVNTGWSNKVGELRYTVSGNLSTVGSKIIFNDEPSETYPMLAKVGGPINQIRGYVAEGLFDSSNLNAASITGYTPSVGDVKYKDINEDGVIDSYDLTVIGNKKPLVFYGANMGLQFKGFDMNVLFQGVANREIMTTGDYEFPFNNNGKGQAFEYNLDRYTPQSASTATLPRVTLGTDVNNYISSSLFLRNGNYIRLKNIELGYSFGTRLLSSVKVKRIRVFINAHNLATFSKYKESDPENYKGLYPLQRIINGGLSVKL